MYDLTTHYPAASHVALSPFETFREPLVIIAIADGPELSRTPYRENPRRSVNGYGPPKPEHFLRELNQDLEDLRDNYPKALVHQVLLFDYVHESSPTKLPEGLVAVPPAAECKLTTMKTIMCDISSMLLAEMTGLAKSLQGLSTIESPKLAQGLWGQTGNFWPSGQSADLSRQNSQVTLNGHERDASPAGSRDRARDRMSMPALRPGASYFNTPALGGRPTTPNDSSFDQAPNTSQSNSFAARFMTPNPNRDTSRDRVSVQGFGPGSVSERSRNVGRGRVGIVIGSLYLNAGRWNDGLKELMEGASLAKQNLDHLWHAKALENILVGMLMLAWSGLDFFIPQVCYVSPPPTISAESSSRLASLHNLTALLPELCERILGLYARAANNTGEALPQLPFSETIIRISKLLAAVHNAGGTIDDEVLRLIVIGTPLKKVPNLLTPRLTIIPSRADITAILFRAFPSPSSSDHLPVVDRTMILGGIASVLGSLGYSRKKALVIRELVSVLVPGLVQARIAGAAEMGVHPAAGLAALAASNGNTNGAGGLDLGEGDIENGVDAFLGLLSQVYGVVTSKTDSIDDTDEGVIARITHDAIIRAFGGQNLKMDVLRSCINLSEALPDFHGVLRFTADLLRTAGSGVAPGPRSEDASPSMSREEQIRLSNNISRTLGAARNLGVKNLAAEYWDEFLVRGVDLEPLPLSRTPIPHARSELPGSTAVASTGERNPFIYNPFLRTPDTAAVEYLLVSGEGAVFKVTLQNPYEFDVEIENIRLEAEGAEFASSLQKTIIGPYRTQILTLPGTPKAPGHVKITGCLVKVRGCRERRFPIFEDPWSPQRELKVKTIGVAGILTKKDRPVSVGSGPPPTLATMIPPKNTSLELNVISKQPVVVVRSNTLSQSAVMVLEGERQTFSITLENISRDTPVNLLLFSFKDSTQAPLKTAMSDREKSPAELYELELIFARKQALRWVQTDDEKLFIAPGATATFEMEILGKPGLTSAVVQIDYAFLGTPPTEIESKFYTRQVSLPITVTVNASVELARMDILPLHGTMPSSIWNKCGPGDIDKDLSPADYCLLLLDLRNAWPSELHVNLHITDGSGIDEEILPGNTSRIMFPIRRMFLPNASASIPSLDPSRQRQFVVSTGRVSADSERATREAFWYREEVLRLLSGSWSTKTGLSRTGNIELRGIRLTQRMVEALRIDDVGIEISINGEPAGSLMHQINTDNFCEIKAKASNRTNSPIYPLLRIQPSIRNQPHNQSLDLPKKFVWNGALQQALPELAGGATMEVVLGMTALCRGEFEINASIEESRIPSALQEVETVGGAGRPRTNTKTLMDTLLGTRARRIWHSREPCLLVVIDGVDGESDDDESGTDSVE